MKQAIEPIRKIGNVTIDRNNQKVTVEGARVPTLLREWQLIDYLASTQGPVAMEAIANSAFKDTELRTRQAVKAIASHLRAKLTTHGGARGVVHIDGDYLTMFEPSATVTVDAFHYPDARWTCQPENSSVPDREACELIWHGEVEEMTDLMLLNGVWATLNQDDRPNRTFASSLAVGDLITIQPDTLEAVTYQVASSGFVRLKGTISADPIDRDTISRQYTPSAS